MQDSMNRRIDYIRISLTDHCNLRCCYCMPEAQKHFLSGEELMTREEITTIMRVMARNGIRKVKLTGGEPLLRKDLAEIVRELHCLEGVEQITLTTNGILLKDRMKELAEAGITSINISLDTRSPEKYQEITKRDYYSQVLEGIEEALSYPGIPVKINCVPIDNSRENILAMAELARERKLSVRFIELMPLGSGADHRHCSEEYIKDLLEEAYGSMTPLKKAMGNGPARYYELPGFQGKIGFISSISHKFCASCNRIRLTSEGILKTCLQYEGNLNLKELLRQGMSEEELERTVQEEVLRKPVGHHFFEQRTDRDEKGSIGSIGG
jgi:cyclic pyranopterin phosphate synthase